MPDRGKTAAACESIVQADFLHRGYEVTKPLSATSKHDLHVDFPSVGWKGVQVKAASRNARTGGLRHHSRRDKIKSPILALVLLPSKIVYEAGTEPLPIEIETFLDAFLKGLDK